MGLKLFGREGPGGPFSELVVVQDAAIGLQAIIALHSTERGPAFGGIRRRAYESEDAGLADVLALAEAMSFKCALAGLWAGGGKTVMFEHPEADIDACYAALGEAIERLAGRYVCGPDLGTGDAELAVVRSKTRFVNPVGNDAGRSTAHGVLAGMRATWRMLDAAPQGSSVAIAGLGSVGIALAEALLRLGVRVYGADLRGEACDVAAELGVAIVPPERILSTACDVLAPCAVGHVLDRPTVEALRCRAVCGSANNQLASADAAGFLVERGVLHVPDVVVSAGAVIEGVLTVAAAGDPRSAHNVAAAIERIEHVAFDVMREASQTGAPPTEVAITRARSLLDG